jgi:phage regulator Rha-like protein
MKPEDLVKVGEAKNAWEAAPIVDSLTDLCKNKDTLDACTKAIISRAYDIEVTPAERSQLIQLDNEWKELGTQDGIKRYIQILGETRTALILTAVAFQGKVNVIVK